MNSSIAGSILSLSLSRGLCHRLRDQDVLIGQGGKLLGHTQSCGLQLFLDDLFAQRHGEGAPAVAWGSHTVLLSARNKGQAEVVDVAEKRYDIHVRELLQSDGVSGTGYRTEAGSLRLLLISN